MCAISQRESLKLFGLHLRGVRSNNIYLVNRPAIGGALKSQGLGVELAALRECASHFGQTKDLLQMQSLGLFPEYHPIR